MRAIQLVFRAELRRRWRSWVALALLVTITGGGVMAAVAAGRRTSSAFPSFNDRYGYDAVIYSYRAVPGIASLPEVESYVHLPVYSFVGMSVHGTVVPTSDTEVFATPPATAPRSAVAAAFPAPP